MNSLAVIVPTRGRPANAARLASACAETATVAEVVYAVDESDPTLPGYDLHLEQHSTVRFPGHPTMIEKLNDVARHLSGQYDYLGFMGDDHLPRTVDWDLQVIGALQAKGPGIVYCNDLFQGPNLPTAVFMHADIVRALGWMALPELQHLYCDNAWLDLGQALGACTYLHGTVIEHLHPHAGKAAGDDQYARVNADELAAADRAVWEWWRTHQLATDVAAIRAAVAA